MSKTIVILGAGVAGLTHAVELAKNNAQVHLVDPYLHPGAHQCSWWAGGMLAPYCESATAEPMIANLGEEAAAWWQSFPGLVQQRGSLVVATSRDQQQLVQFARRTTNHSWLKQEELASYEPDLAAHFPKALFYKDEAHLDPRAALNALWNEIRKHNIGISKDIPSISYDYLVDCRGLTAQDELPQLRGVRGEMLMLFSKDINYQRPIRFLHPRYPLYIVPRGKGVFMLGATQIESQHRGPITVRSAVELLNAAYSLHPGFAEAEIIEMGADARPAFFDNLPRIISKNNKIYVNGLFRHGFLLAPALACRTTALILEGKEPTLS